MCRCHADPAPGSRAPGLDGLREQAAASVLDALTTGVMRPQAQRLNPSEIRAVAEYVTGRKLAGEVVDLSIGRCAVQTAMTDIEKTPRWNGWGADLSNTRFQPAAQAALTAADVPRLTLKWAFGLPNTSHAWSQPSVVGGRVFVGSQGGRVYALDATTGEELWKTRVEDHLSTRATGSPVLHERVSHRNGLPASWGDGCHVASVGDQANSFRPAAVMATTAGCLMRRSAEIT